MSKQAIAAVIQGAGLSCAVVAGSLVDAALGFATAAVSLVLIGVSLERS